MCLDSSAYEKMVDTTENRTTINNDLTGIYRRRTINCIKIDYILFLLTPLMLLLSLIILLYEAYSYKFFSHQSK